MKEIKALVLCSTRFAGSVVYHLLNAKVLSAVAVPETADETADYAASLLQGSDVPVIRVTAAGYEQELITIIREREISVCFMLTFGYKIPPSVYTLPAMGFYNFHPGPLPLYRGPDPIFQQIKRMEEYAGIVIHKLDENFDTGPVIMKERIKLTPGDTYGLITTKLGFTATKMVGVLLKMLAMDIVPPSKPQDNTIATYYKKQAGTDVMISWVNMTADEIVSLIGACNPWNKGAVTHINQMVMRIPEAKKGTAPSPADMAPGTVISITENEMKVSCINNEYISVAFVHVEEGFFSAGRLTEFGIVPGLQFSNIK